MKLQKIIKSTLATIFAGTVIFTLSSNSNGFSSSNYTGAKGGPVGCNCHGSNNTATSISFYLDSAGTIVTSYKAGVQYTLKILAGNLANLPYFGFQVACVSGTGTAQVQAGTWGAVTPSASTQIKTMNTLNVVEHRTPIAITASTHTYDVSVKWTAPAAGTGTVYVYCSLNAVNGTGNESGDVPNSRTVSIDEQVAVPNSVAELSNNIAVTAFPNPVSDQLHISVDNAKPGNYNIYLYDLGGKMVSMRSIDINGSLETSISTSSLAAGMYFLQITNGKEQFRQTIVKK